MLMNIGRIVRERRQAKGMTIEQLAEKADVSVSLISRLERERVDNIRSCLRSLLTSKQDPYKGHSNHDFTGI